MLRTRWRKVWRDLAGNRVRTFLVVLSIAIGVFAIGTIVGTQIILEEDLTGNYLGTNPADAILFVLPFDDELVHAAERVSGVAEVQARRSVRVRVQTGPDEWRSLSLDVVPDFDDQRINQVRYESGQWPPPDRGLLLERTSLALVKAEVGDLLTVEMPDGRFRQIVISGLVHDINKMPSRFVGQPYGYINLDTLEWLGFTPHYDEMLLQVSGQPQTRDDVRAITDRVERQLERSGHTVHYTWVPVPGEHPAYEIIAPLLLILGVLGALTLFASSFLVINIINGLLTQQVQQIGIMRAIGGRRQQIGGMYLVAVLSFGLLALLLAVPLGGVAAYAFTDFIASLVNFDMAHFRVPLRAILVMILVGLLVPIVAAAYPVFRGVNITVREALSEQGIGQGQYGLGWLDRLLNFFTSRLLRLSQPLRISLRNTIRRKSRLAFTLSTLILGGSIFIAIICVHVSLLATLDSALNYFQFDVEVGFNRPYRIEEMQREALKLPGVVYADSRINSSARRVQADGSEGPNFSLLGTEAETRLIQPLLLEGRWLEPADTNQIVINSLLLKDEPDLQVGDWLSLQIDQRQSEWQVVGLVQGVMTGPIGYVNRPFLERELRSVGRATGLQVIVEPSSPAIQARLAYELKEHFDSVGMRVTSTRTSTDIRENIEYQFSLLVTFLVIMGLLIAVVGGLGLMGTMSINVLERTREIGVMRAVGASDGAILRIVLVEGVFVGLISWFFSSLLAYPLGRLLSDAVGLAFMESPLIYRYAYGGSLGWLLAIITIAALASYLPARNASRLSVRETLAYE